MKLTRRQHKTSTEMSIAPLIDIILLLIIFCMTVTQLSKNEIEPLDLPESVQGIDMTDIEQKRLIINVLDSGKIIVSGVTFTEHMLANLLDNTRADLLSAETTVVIRSDQATPWTKVARILRLCADRQIRNVNVAVTEPE